MPRNRTTWTKETRPLTTRSGGRRKGVKNKRTVLRDQIGLGSWKALQTYLETYGVEKLIAEMEKLSGMNFVRAFTWLFEYVRPKLHRDTAASNPPEDDPRYRSFLSLPVEDQVLISELLARAEQEAGPLPDQELPEE